jgi:uncharacterized protein YbjT (DUF2867 family)
MFIIVGGTGRVGSATAEALLAEGQPVTVITRSASKGELWTKRGASVAVTDVHDIDALRTIFQRGRRALLINPPADPSSDTDAEERATVRCLLAALDGSGLEKVVALSTYGARPGGECGDLTVLHDFEQGLRAQPIPVAIMRAAYMMSNWQLDAASRSGALLAMLPRDLKLPMAAPKDLGAVAARLLQEPAGGIETYYAEGPERYSPGDVAAALAGALGRAIEVEVVARERWEETFRSFGFSEKAARSYACMTGVTVDELELPASPIRGDTSLTDYVSIALKE